MMHIHEGAPQTWETMPEEAKEALKSEMEGHVKMAMEHVDINRDGKMSFEEAVKAFCSGQVDYSSDGDEFQKSEDPEKEFITKLGQEPMWSFWNGMDIWRHRAQGLTGKRVF